jgi:hypothetical protein
MERQMSNAAISTEGRVFVNQMIRDLRARERLGAGLLSPGATKWREAIHAFGHSMVGCGGPVKAGKLFNAGRERLIVAQRKHNACLLNFFMVRKRSGLFQVLVYDVAKHPLTGSGYEGVIVRSCFYRLQRIGCATFWSNKVAFVSWHALGRLYERSGFDMREANAVVCMLGIAGMLMRESEKHNNNSINIAFDHDMLCTGVMRHLTGIEDGKPRKTVFFDCLTMLPGGEPKYAQQRAQGGHVAHAVKTYMDSDSADPRGYADKIPVLPFNRDDYVTQELRRKQEKTDATNSV